MAVDPESLLQSNLDIDKRQNHVKLTSTHLYWDSVNKKNHINQGVSEPLFRHYSNTVPLCEVITVNYKTKGPAEGLSQDKRNHGSPVYIEMQPLKPTSFAVHYIKRVSNYKWKVKKTVFCCLSDKAYLCQQWVNTIKEAINRLGGINRPARLLVFVNPFGGKRKAPKIYDEKIAPLFELADIHTDVIETQRQNHARDILQTYDLASIQGVVCVGGDGMFAELMNGLLCRKMKDLGLETSIFVPPVSPDLRIGIIPAGSTDAVVYSTTGTNDPVTSALHIILGDSIGLDVSGVYDGNKLLRYNTTMLSYGYYGDMLKDSENLRWMGPKRYQVSGTKKFLTNKSYEAELYLKLAEDSNHPRDKSFCLNGCNVCISTNNKETEEDYTGDGTSIGSSYVTGSYQSSFYTSADESGSHASIPSLVPTGVIEEDIRLCVQNTPCFDDFHKVRGYFKVVSSFTMSCRNAMTPIGMSPASHLGDGTTDLMLVDRCSRLQFLRHLTRCPEKTDRHFDFDFVKVYRVKEFVFKAIYIPEMDPAFQGQGKSSEKEKRNPTLSLWNCDGEILESTYLHVKVHCKLIRLFARGIEDIEQISKRYGSCCDSCDIET